MTPALSISTGPATLAFAGWPAEQCRVGGMREGKTAGRCLSASRFSASLSPSSAPLSLPLPLPLLPQCAWKPESQPPSGHLTHIFLGSAAPWAQQGAELCSLLGAARQGARCSHPCRAQTWPIAEASQSPQPPSEASLPAGMALPRRGVDAVLCSGSWEPSKGKISAMDPVFIPTCDIKVLHPGCFALVLIFKSIALQCNWPGLPRAL